MDKHSNICIPGASGMVGSAIVRTLLEKGCTNLIGSYHTREPRSGIFWPKGEGDTLPPGLRLVQMDLRRQDIVEQFFKNEAPDYVFLAAAKVGGIHANNTCPAQFIHDNLVIQTNIIHAAYQAKVRRLLFLGSSCIYPKMAPQPLKEEYLLTGPLEPTNSAYAMAKIAGIEMCWAYNRQYGTQFIPVMPTNLYGPNDNFDLTTSHVLPALIRKFHLAKLAMEQNREGINTDETLFGPIPEDIRKALPEVVLWGSGSPKREFLHVDDLADACRHIMIQPQQRLKEVTSNNSFTPLINIGTGKDVTIRELARTIQQATGDTGDIHWDKEKPDGTPRKVLDTTRLTQLGWHPKTPLTTGIQSTIEWYRQNSKQHEGSTEIKLPVNPK